MQGKGLIRFFTYVLLAVVAYQLILVWPVWSVESDAADYAEELSADIDDPNDQKEEYARYRQLYLDSISDKPVFNFLFVKSFTYQQLKRQQLALGLDLKGGMSVTLQVDLEDLVKSLAGKSNEGNELLTKAIAQAKKNQTNSNEDFVTLFGRAYQENSNGKGLAIMFTATDGLSSENITTTSTDEEVIAAIRKKAVLTVSNTYDLLKKRIDRFGVAQPVVSLDETTDRITVELPGVSDPNRARELLQATANLEFWDVYQNGDVLSYLDRLNSTLKEQEAKSEQPQTAPSDTTQLDSLGNPIIDTLQGGSMAETTLENDSITNPSDFGPLFSKLIPNTGQLSAIIGQAKLSDTAAINRILETKEAKRILPKSARLLWADKPVTIEEENEGIAERTILLYAVNTKNKKESELQGKHLDGAYVSTAQNGEYAVLLDMNNKGARIWKDMTQRNIGREVAIVLDNRVCSAPRVNSVIEGGNTEITGGFTSMEANDLANILSVGQLPGKVEIIEEAIVGPTLGEATVRAGLIALLVGFLLVLGFMLVYYTRSGIISILCLFLNLILILGALASFGTVLTLPGIAGIVLTIGMAVDANVIIYERIREELRAGTEWKESIKAGFKQSYSAIIDANVTTFAVAMVLFLYGLGPIKGFATVLMIGVACSVYSAVLVGRLIFDNWMAKDKPIAVGSKGTMNVLANPNINFMAKRKITYAISGLIIVAGIVSIVMSGFELGVDLQGGRSYTVEFPADEVDNTALKDALVANFEGFTAEGLDDNDKNASNTIVRTFGADNQVKITTSFLQKSTLENIDSIVQLRVYEACKAFAGSDVSQEAFVAGRPIDNEEAGLYLSASSTVNAIIADDLRQSAYAGAAWALGIIFFYILIRFRRWQFSAGTIAALTHDVLVVLGLFSLLKGIMPFSMEIDQAFIAAILTIIGYSVNDTVIVFDRIRETATEREGDSIINIANIAINRTLSRTSITSLTTFLVILILFIFGGDGIRGFAFALLLGVLVGTYSSIFIATPVVVDTTKDAGSLKYVERKREELVSTGDELGEDEEAAETEEEKA